MGEQNDRSRTDMELLASKADALLATMAEVHKIQANIAQQAVPASFQNSELFEHIRISSVTAGTTVHNASTATGTASTVYSGLAELTAALSQFGVPLDQERQDRIQDWTENLDKAESDDQWKTAR